MYHKTNLHHYFELGIYYSSVYHNKQCNYVVVYIDHLLLCISNPIHLLHTQAGEPLTPISSPPSSQLCSQTPPLFSQQSLTTTSEPPLPSLTPLTPGPSTPTIPTSDTTNPRRQLLRTSATQMNPVYSAHIQRHLDSGIVRFVWDRFIEETANYIVDYHPDEHSYQDLGRTLCHKYPCVAHQQGRNEWVCIDTNDYAIDPHVRC